MTFENHITSTCKQCFIQLKQIARNRRNLDFNTAKIVVMSTVLSKLNFSAALYVGLPKNIKSRMQKVQNYAARIVTKTSKHEHITPILHQLKWLTVQQYAMYRLLSIVQNCIIGNGPAYINELLTKYLPNRPLRSSDLQLLTIPDIRTRLGRRSFSYLAPFYYNRLPSDIKQIPAMTTFKKVLKEFLFNNPSFIVND